MRPTKVWIPTSKPQTRDPPAPLLRIPWPCAPPKAIHLAQDWAEFLCQGGAGSAATGRGGGD